MIDDVFKDVFGYDAAATGFTPGRVNLIGEHTDYNGGMVLPTALPLGISLAMAPREDDRVFIQSDKFEGIAERNLTDTASDHWSDYILGALVLANKDALISGGADIAISSTLPFGAGISSSAAVTVGVLKLIRELSKVTLSDQDVAVLAREVENEFIGMPCGIMDQMAVAIARPGQAIALQTDTLDFQRIDLPSDFHMAVIHSGVFRQLNEGRYKARKEECDAVKQALGHDALCQMTSGEFEILRTLPDHLIRRARHCMTEHRRTVKAVDAIKANNMNMFGRLMVESHASMRDDFEITVPQIDQLVHNAVRFGALGARMTGGGFGGCIVACVAIDHLSEWKTNLLSQHEKAFEVC